MTTTTSQAEKCGVRIKFIEGASYDPEWDTGARHFAVTLYRDGKRFTTPYHMGSALEGDPDADNVLDSLILDASADGQAFEAWAGDFGYDPDSKRAERLYNACLRSANGLKRLFGDAYEKLLRDWEPL